MVSSMTRLELAEVLDRESPVPMLDVRPLAAYNGWALNDEARGGHITGATPLPLAWLQSLGDDEIVAVLGERGVPPGTDLVVYGFGRDDAVLAATRLQALGFGSPRFLAGGLAG